MTFLELCQQVGLVSGLISTQNQMTTTVGQVGRQLKIVTFTAMAYRRLQTSRTDWEWLRGTFSHALVIGQADYTPAELGIATRFKAFCVDVPVDGYRPMRLYNAGLGVADSQDLYQISPELYDQVYGRGVQTAQRPTEYALAQGKLFVAVKPDAAYTLDGCYWKAPQILAADGDVPELPAHFHDIITWGAIKLISGQEGAFADRAVALGDYSSMYRQLVTEQTRRISLGRPLA